MARGTNANQVAYGAAIAQLNRAFSGSPVVLTAQLSASASARTFPGVRIDSRGFSGGQAALIERTVDFLFENYPSDFGQAADPIQIVQRDNLRDANAYAETGWSAAGHIEVALHLDALRNPNNLRSIVGHEFVHGLDISLQRVPPTPAGDVRSEQNGLNWEWQNAGRNQITTRFRMRLQEQIQEWRRR